MARTARRSGRPARARLRPRHVPLFRLRVGFLLIAMVLSVFAVRLFQLQGLDARTYAERARAVGAVEELLPATRGSILDRDGTPLAESLDGSMIVADPTRTGEDAAAIASVLERRLGLDYIETVRNLTWPGTRFRFIARWVPTTRAVRAVEEVERLGYEGLALREDPVRSYPAQDVAANVVGYINAEGFPVSGAELVFDSLLKGKDGSATYDVGGGNRVPLGDNSTTEPVDGKDLTLTIDRDLSWYTARVLRQTVEDAGGLSGSAVVMDTRTGELLALADYPTYNPNEQYQRAKELIGARSLRDMYEPGSVQKVLTVAAAIDVGLVTPETPLRIPKNIKSSDKVIHDYFDHKRAILPWTLTGVIAQSSNIGTVMVARKMEREVLHRYLRAFGLGAVTGIVGYGESPGSLSPWQDWLEINADNIAFGQGLAVNAVQMAAAVNTIANGGVYVQPSLVKGEVTTSQGLVTGSAVAQRRRVVSERAAGLTRDMMEAVVDKEKGTAGPAAITGYRVAGKTGTAQKVNDECKCYDGKTFTVSFAGFAPADDPRFTVYVVVQNPTNGAGGGATGGPAFRKIMSHLLQRYKVAPTGTEPRDLSVEWVPDRRRPVVPPVAAQAADPWYLPR
jgi:cell division protein FtsI (penicillin-binding protein 3)